MEITVSGKKVDLNFVAITVLILVADLIKRAIF